MAEPHLRLKSSWGDYYDHAFAGRWRDELPVWNRDARTDHTRAADHDLLAAHGLAVPVDRGTLVTRAGDGMYVAYTDPYAHRGEGKERGVRAQLLTSVPPATYSIAWVGAPVNGCSLRVLAVGRWLYYLDYVQQNATAEWRSNVGDVAVRLGDRHGLDDFVVLKACLAIQAARRTPMLAIDFVRDEQDVAWAIDLNVSPGLRGTPVETELRPSAVYDLCRHRWAEIERSA